MDGKVLLRQLQAENACLKVKDLAVSGNDLMALGISAGPMLGKCLNHLLELVLDEQLPNEKEPLLTEAANYI